MFCYFRRLVCKKVAKMRLRSLSRRSGVVFSEKAEELLANALYTNGIFVQAKENCCPTCAHNIKLKHGECCEKHDEWISKIKTRTCKDYEPNK